MNTHELSKQEGKFIRQQRPNQLKLIPKKDNHQKLKSQNIQLDLSEYYQEDYQSLKHLVTLKPNLLIEVAILTLSKLNLTLNNFKFIKTMILFLWQVMVSLIKCQTKTCLSVFGIAVIETNGSKIQTTNLHKVFISNVVWLLSQFLRTHYIDKVQTM